MEVEDPEYMILFLAKDLTWIEIDGDQVLVIPYCRLDDFISGEESNESAPTQFLLKSHQSQKIEDIKHTYFSTYLEYVVQVSIYFSRYI